MSTRTSEIFLHGAESLLDKLQGEPRLSAAQYMEIRALLETWSQDHQTLQMETEDALHQANDIIEMMQVGLFVYELEDLNDDRTLRLVAANPASERLTGMMAANGIGKYIDEVFPFVREHGIPERFAQVIRTGMSGNFEDVYLLPDHQLINAFSVQAFPLPAQRVGVTFDNITPGKKIQRELLESEQRFRTLFHDAPVMNFIHDPETGGLLEVNRAVLDSLGYRNLEELLETKAWVCEAPYDEAAALQNIHKARREGLHRFEWKNRRKNGEVFWEMVTLRRIMLGTQERILASCIDITQQKQLEFYLEAGRKRAEIQLDFPRRLEELGEADFLQYAQEKTEILTESEIAFLHFVDEDAGTLERVSWSGRTLEKYCTAAHDSHDPLQEAGAWADALRQRKPVIVNDYASYPNKQGLPEGHAPLERFISVPVIENGKIVMLAGVGNKTSDYNAYDVETVQTLANEIWNLVQRKRGQQALMESEQRLRALSEQVPGVVFVFQMRPDGDSRFVYVSEHVRDVYGLPPRELCQDAAPLFQRLHPEDYEPVMASILESFQTLSLWEKEARYLHPEKGLIWHWGVASPTLQADGSVVWHGFLADITERKSAEEALRLSNTRLTAATEEARELAKAAQAANEAKSAFLANMSHEIRTPMNGILGMTDLLKETPLSREQTDYVNVVHSSATLLLELLNDLLDLTKIEAGKFDLLKARFELGALYNEICTPAQYLAEQKGLAFLREQTPGTPLFLEGDSIRLRQLFTNLLNNAIKFTDQGSVTFRMDVLPVSDSVWELRAEIDDTGVGIPSEERDRIFEKFHQVDNSSRRRHGGSGLGLHICRQLAGMMGGSITLESGKEAGSLFRVVIPLRPAPRDESTGSSPPPAENPFQNRSCRDMYADQNIRVLVVEDNPVNQEVARAIFLKLGITPAVVGRAAAALDLLREQEWDLVFTDLQMPEMDGFEFLHTLRDPSGRCRNPAVPVVAMTAHAMHGDAERCKEEGMDGFIAKPVTPHAVAREIARWFTPSAPPLSPLESTCDGARILDFEGLCERLMGDRAFAKELLLHFLDDIPRQEKALADSLNSGDPESFTRVNHTIKGASANLNALALHALTAEMQQRIRAGDTLNPGEVLGRFHLAFQQLRETIAGLESHPCV